MNTGELFPSRIIIKRTIVEQLYFLNNQLFVSYTIIYAIYSYVIVAIYEMRSRINFGNHSTFFQNLTQ